MERIVTQYNAARGVIRLIVPQQETIGPNGPIIARGLPFIRGEWTVPGVLALGEHDAEAFFGSDMLRGKVYVIEVRASHEHGKGTVSIARFVSKGPITSGKTCPAVLRRLIEEAVPQHV